MKDKMCKERFTRCIFEKLYYRSQHQILTETIIKRPCYVFSMNNQQQQLVPVFRAVVLHGGVKRSAEGQHPEEPPQKRRKLESPQVPQVPQVQQAQPQRQEEPMEID